MKRRKVKLLALFLSVILAVMTATPAFSWPFASPNYGLNEYDQEMLLAFWQQPAYDGLTNGEAVYDIHLGEGGFISGGAPTYDGSYWTYLLEDHSLSNGTITFDMYLYYWLEGWSGTPLPTPGPEFSVYDIPFVNVNPDLYGTLDLHGTNINSLVSGGDSRTHITDIVLDDCPHLYMIDFIHQPAANTLSAKNCPISRIQTFGSTFKSIEYDCRAYSETMHIMSDGEGCVSVYHYRPNEIASQLTATSMGEMFMGWYKDSELISTEPTVEVTEGGEYTARFGGDVDGDGTVTSADALLLMRMCMGLIPMEGMDADVNMNGEQDVVDALMILRFVMGMI